MNQNNVKFIAAVYGMVYNVDLIQTSCITYDVDSIQAVYMSHAREFYASLMNITQAVCLSYITWI